MQFGRRLTVRMMCCFDKFLSNIVYLIGNDGEIDTVLAASTAGNAENPVNVFPTPRLIFVSLHWE
jgi:hypothetical protein